MDTSEVPEATVQSPSTVNGAHPSPSPDRLTEGRGGRSARLVALDGMRFLAALMVLAYHYTYYGRGAWPDGGFPLAASVSRYGWLGVNLFFLISGFVICMSSWGRGLGEFVVSRVTRLFPAYWFAVLFTTALLVLLSLPRLTFREILDNLTMMQQPLGTAAVDGSYWTLWRELLFYLLFAVVVWRGVNYRRVLSFCVLWMLASVLASAYPDGFIARFVDVEYSMYFVAGIAMYLMYRFRPTLLLWGLLGWSWILAEHQLGRVEGALELGGVGRRWWIASAIVTLSFLLVLAAALGWLNWARWRVLSLLGALTYPLYLVHQTVGMSIIWKFGAGSNKYVLLPCLVAGMLLLAWLIHRFIERPVAPVVKRHLRRAIAEAITHSDAAHSDAAHSDAARSDAATPSGRHAHPARSLIWPPRHADIPVQRLPTEVGELAQPTQPA
jgi:peptidoglycan/LPS O-acetylase OafA/YrhL